MRGQGEQIWRSTRGEACLDAGKAVRVSVSVPLTAGFDRLLLALGVVCLAQDGQKGDRGLKAAGNPVNVGLIAPVRPARRAQILRWRPL